MEASGLIKSGFVTIIGLPNAGKSTFLNSVLNDNLAITSKKPQTTRKNLKGIFNDDESQIVFVDTPGIHKGKNKLDEFMSLSIKKSLDDIDLVLVIVDAQSYNHDDYTSILNTVKNNRAKKILVINKIDLFADKEEIDEVKNQIIEKFDNKIDFTDILKISALKKKNVTDVIRTIKNNLPDNYPYYNRDDLTDEPLKQIISEMIRQQCLYKLDKEVPHGVAIVVESIKVSKSKTTNIEAIIVCEKQTHKGIVIGKSGSMIKNIGTGARIAIEKFLGKKVNLKLGVVVKENWRDERTLITNYGYDINRI